MTQNKESFLEKLDSKLCGLSLMCSGLNDTWTEKLSFGKPNMFSFKNRVLVSQIIFSHDLSSYKHYIFTLKILKSSENYEELWSSSKKNYKELLKNISQLKS